MGAIVKTLLSALLFASLCRAQTITLVQHTSSSSTTIAATSQSTAFASNPAQNHLLVAGGGNRSGGAISSCSDTLLNAWTVVQTVNNGTNSNSGICWAIQTHAAGADSVTMNDSASGKQFFVGIAEYSVSTSWPSTPTDVGATGTGTAAAVATASFTTTGTDVIFAVENNATTQASVAAGSGYTLLDFQTASSAVKGADEDELNATAGSYQGTFTNGGTDTGWSVSAEAFKPNAPAGAVCANFIALMGAGCK